MADSLIAISIFSGLATALAYGVQEAVAKKLLSDREPRPVMWLWMAAGLPFAAAAALLASGGFPAAWLTGGTWAFSLLGTLCWAIAFDRYYAGVKAGRVSVMAPLNSLSAILLVGLGVLFLQAEITAGIVASVILASAGTALSAISERKASLRENRGFPETKYLAISIPFFAIAGLCYIIVMRRIGIFWEFAIDRAIFVSILAVAYRSELAGSLKMQMKNLPAGLFLALVGLNVFAALASSFGIVNGLPALVIPLASTGAAFTALIGIFLYRERLSPAQKVGILLVASSVAAASA